MEIVIERREQSVQKYLCPKCEYPYTITESWNTEDIYTGAKCDGCGYIRTNTDKRRFDRVYYEKECISCGEKLFLLTQSDDGDSEYHTNVGMQCHVCKEINWFSLPVN